MLDRAELSAKTEYTDEGHPYTVQSHTSFLAHVGLIDSKHLILHDRLRDREPTPDEIRELAGALLAVADAIENSSGAVPDVRADCCG